MASLYKRTHYAGTLSANNVGEKVTVCGWVQKRRDLGSLIFVTVRDRCGIVQLIFDENIEKTLFDIAFTLRSEYVIAASGIVRLRQGAANTQMATGEIEIVVEQLNVLNTAQTTPFEIIENVNAKEELRLKYRYLDLRRPDAQAPIILRHKVAKNTRDYFDKNGFLELETPILQKSTPEGARDYLVPSRVHPGSFYALPQSPQIYKQLLMIAGFDRYFQLARCFRDEDLRADRQPEFTQIDLEMSFVEMPEIMELMENYFVHLFKNVLNVEIKTPFLKLTYTEAQDRFGSDKPDMRFGFELCDVSEQVSGSEFKLFEQALQSDGIVRGINVNGYGDKFSRKEIDSLAEFVKTYNAGGLLWLKKQNNEISSSFSKFLTPELSNLLCEKLCIKNGDIAFLVADKKETVLSALGALRCEVAKRLGLLKYDDFKFLWMIDFPEFEFSFEDNRYYAVHHPFTAPVDEDIELIETDPLMVRAKAYDVILNGIELGGGSIRIHDRQLQERIFETLGLSMEEAGEKFGFLLDALRYGAPPHGGIALGIDRLVMLMCGTESIRDCIPFPKVQNASELMSNCPSNVSQKQLDELCIATTVEKK